MTRRANFAANLPVRLTVGTLLFATAVSDLDPTGRLWIAAERLRGWDDRPDERRQRVAHPGGFGDYSGQRGSKSRQLTLSGYVLGETVAETGEAIDRINSLRTELLVADERSRVFAREATVDVVAVDWTRVTDHCFDFSITMIADDPLRYSTESTALASTTSLTNRGSERAEPVLEFTGPHGALSIAHPGGTYGLTALASGARRVVDVRNGDVWNAQGARLFGVDSGPAPSVPARSTVAWTVGGLGSGSARVRRFEAWL